MYIYMYNWITAVQQKLTHYKSAILPKIKKQKPLGKAGHVLRLFQPGCPTWGMKWALPAPSPEEGWHTSGSSKLKTSSQLTHLSVTHSNAKANREEVLTVFCWCSPLLLLFLNTHTPVCASSKGTDFLQDIHSVKNTLIPTSLTFLATSREK